MMKILESMLKLRNNNNNKNHSGILEVFLELFISAMVSLALSSKVDAEHF